MSETSLAKPSGPRLSLIMTPSRIPVSTWPLVITVGRFTFVISTGHDAKSRDLMMMIFHKLIVIR